MIGAAQLQRPLDYARHTGRRRRWLAELATLLAMPTVSAQPQHRPDLDRAAEWLARHLSSIGLPEVQLLPGLRGGPPSVYAAWCQAPAQPTLLIYGHYDVQPADPISAWSTPPFRATRSGASLVARGASDNKGQLFVQLKALESYLATTGALPLNVKIWLEGEEEVGSPGLGALLQRELERFKADAVLISDTRMANHNQPALVYGMRGSLTLELEVCGPRHDLHSGLYGGTVLNPIQALCQIIAGLHDAEHKIAIPGFYRAVRKISPAERRRLLRAGQSEQQLEDIRGVTALWGEAGFSPHERVMLRPALSISGIQGGYNGPGAKTIIPARATAMINVRLVPDQQPEQIVELIRQYIRKVCPAEVRARMRILSTTRPVLLPLQHPALHAAARAVAAVWGRPPSYTRSGGSIPVVELLRSQLAVPIVLLGFSAPDDRSHGPDERLHLPTFFRAVETIIRFFAEYAR